MGEEKAELETGADFSIPSLVAMVSNMGAVGGRKPSNCSGRMKCNNAPVCHTFQ